MKNSKQGSTRQSTSNQLLTTIGLELDPKVPNRVLLANQLLFPNQLLATIGLELDPKAGPVLKSRTKLQNQVVANFPRSLTGRKGKSPLTIDILSTNLEP